MTKKNTFKSVLYAGAAIAASTRVHNQVHQLFQLHKTRLHQLHLTRVLHNKVFLMLHQL